MRALRAMFGDDVTACIGKRVQLEAIPLRVAGRDTLPVRINPAPQPATTPSDARPQQPTATAAPTETTPAPPSTDGTQPATLAAAT